MFSMTKKMRTLLLSVGLVATSLGLVACNKDDDESPTSAQSISSLRLIGDYNILSKTMYNGVEFGGISGLDLDTDGKYWAISDDRGGERGAPRFYQLAIDLDQEKIKKVSIQNMIYLRDQNNILLPSDKRTVDPESIRAAANGNLYISSEGNFAAGNALSQPFVREYRKDGHFVKAFEIPKAFEYVDNKTTGGRSNKLFEALTVTAKGKIFTANEDALIQDGPLSSLTAGSVVRVIQLDQNTNKPLAQYAYPIEKIAKAGIDGGYPEDNGLSEMLAISENEFIAVERAFADGVGNTIRLYRTTIEDKTTDVQKMDRLVNAKYTPMKKQLLLELPLTYQNIKLDNIEGISWGPKLKNGNRSLILVADNNFSEQQITQFIAFEVLP